MEIMRSISSEIDAILREEIELAQKDDPALIVRSAFEVIEDFLNQGMSMERIATALQKHDIKITKGHLVRHLGIVREERGLKPLKRGRKPKPSSAPAPDRPSSSPRDPPQAGTSVAAPCPTPAPAAETNSAPTGVGLTPTLLPVEITRLKFIEVKGELLDVTRMNIDDYLTVSKTLPGNGKIPDGMFETVAAENRIRGMYERALSQYDEAITQWKLAQESSNLNIKQPKGHP